VIATAFTVLTLALCIASGMNDNYIVLVGRSKVAPVHIYSAVKFKGKLYTLDLTNPLYKRRTPIQVQAIYTGLKKSRIIVTYSELYAKNIEAKFLLILYIYGVPSTC
jgi:predicted transglutaminase-like protease